jgi:hypothetical protein
MGFPRHNNANQKQSVSQKWLRFQDAYWSELRRLPNSIKIGSSRLIH